MTPSVTTSLRTALRQLETERQRIDRQISAIRSLLEESSSRERRVALGIPGRPKTTRRPMSAAARRAVSQRMKTYWAKRRAAAGKTKAG